MIVTLWLDTALRKDPKYIEWSMKERLSEPLVYKTLLNYKAKHFQERTLTELRQNSFQALVKFTTLDRNLKLFKAVWKPKNTAA